MAKVKIQGHASGTGILTVTAPNTSTDRTITLPDATGTLLATEGAVVINESGADVDFRVESDGNANMLFVDGGNNRVGIGTNAPVTPLGSDLCLEVSDGSAVSLVLDDTRHGNPWTIRNSGGVLSFNMGTTQILSFTDDGVRGLSQFTAKMWVRFVGSDPFGITDSHNVSSMTDNGTGDFTITYSNNMANTNYAPSISPYRDTGDTGLGGANIMAIATGSIRFETVRDLSTKTNPLYCVAHIYGD
jgi:hypothetical protein